MHWVVAYDRPQQALMVMDKFTEAGSAMARRFELERQFASRPDVEVVTLCARSEKDLRVSHSRYFLSSAQQAVSAAAAVKKTHRAEQPNFLKLAARYATRPA